MTDVVVTVPGYLWRTWCAEGDQPGQPWHGQEYAYTIGGRPNIEPGDRVYVVAQGRLRGYAPLIRVEQLDGDGRRFALVRGGGAVAVTIDTPVRGFQGYRYRWWDRSLERPYDFQGGQLAAPGAPG